MVMARGQKMEEGGLVSTDGHNRKNVEQAVVDVLRAHESIMSPVALIDQLIAQGLREDFVRAAMWSLIDQRRIDVTRDRKLLLDRASSPASAS